MKLSVMIEEANKISAKLRKHTVFSRRVDTQQSQPDTMESLFHIDLDNIVYLQRNMGFRWLWKSPHVITASWKPHYSTGRFFLNVVNSFELLDL